LDPRKALYDEFYSLVSDIPLVTPGSPDPPYYDEIHHTGEADLRVLARHWARIAPDERLAALWARMWPWLEDLSRVTREGHDLCHELGVAIGEVEDDSDFDGATTRELPVLYSTPYSDHSSDADEPDIAHSALLGSVLLAELGEPERAAFPAQPPIDVEFELPWHRGRSGWLIGAGAGAVVGAVAAGAVLMWVGVGPSQPSQLAEPAVLSEPIPLSVTDYTHGTCEPTDIQVPTRSAVGATAPLVRRASLDRFGADMDTLIIREPDSDDDIHITVKTQPRHPERPATLRQRVFTTTRSGSPALEIGVPGFSSNHTVVFE
jgi:hypothetical protein